MRSAPVSRLRPAPTKTDLLHFGASFNSKDRRAARERAANPLPPGRLRAVGRFTMAFGVFLVSVTVILVSGAFRTT